MGHLDGKEGKFKLELEYHGEVGAGLSPAMITVDIEHPYSFDESDEPALIQHLIKSISEAFDMPVDRVYLNNEFLDKKALDEEKIKLIKISER